MLATSQTEVLRLGRHLYQKKKKRKKWGRKKKKGRERRRRKEREVSIEV
jgi:hypothetical protein